MWHCPGRTVLAAEVRPSRDFLDLLREGDEWGVDNYFHLTVNGMVLGPHEARFHIAAILEGMKPTWGHEVAAVSR